jgi:NAD(P)-dependent dehydrogenase (short-subunit alcohol dehydrogenase family)
MNRSAVRDDDDRSNDVGAPPRSAIVSGASQGLGLALTAALVARGWHVTVDARHPDALADAVDPLGARAHTVAGDITDPVHRAALVEQAATPTGRIDLIVNNASTLGPLPMRRLADFDADALASVFATNVTAPVSLVQAAQPYLAADACLINISSDAAVNAYEGWGGYGASKAALDHVSRVLAIEHPDLRVLSVDPGDMRTAMHQDAFPGEDISDRPLPEASVPGLLALIDDRVPSGRYIAGHDPSSPDASSHDPSSPDASGEVAS